MEGVAWHTPLRAPPLCAPPSMDCCRSARRDQTGRHTVEAARGHLSVPKGEKGGGGSSRYIIYSGGAHPVI